MKNKFNSSVLHEGHVYGLDEGILTCLDVTQEIESGKADDAGMGKFCLRAAT